MIEFVRYGVACSDCAIWLTNSDDSGAPSDWRAAFDAYFPTGAFFVVESADDDESDVLCGFECDVCTREVYSHRFNLSAEVTLFDAPKPFSGNGSEYAVACGRSGVAIGTVSETEVAVRYADVLETMIIGRDDVTWL